MFGSNFEQQFGLVGPPWDTLDNWQGMFGPNVQSPWELPGNDISGVSQTPGAAKHEPFAGDPSQGKAPAGGPGAPTFQGLTGGIEQKSASEPAGGGKLAGTPQPLTGGGAYHLPVTNQNPLSSGFLAAGGDSEFAGRGM